MIHVGIQSEKFDRALEKLRQLIGGDVGRLLIQEEARQFIKTTIRLDNKLANLYKPKEQSADGKGPRLTPGTKGVREFAVARAIMRTMRPFRPEDFVNKRMRNFVDAVEDGTMPIPQANLILSRIRKSNSPLRDARFSHFDPRYHTANIWPRYGHTKNTGIRIVGLMSKASLNAYIKQVQGRVGFKFSGFLAAAQQLGLKMLKWISRHPHNRGNFELVEISKYGDMYAVIRNNSSKDMRMRTRVQDALSTRARAMATKARRIVAGEALNLGFMTFNPSKMSLDEYRRSPEYRASLEALDND